MIQNYYRNSQEKINNKLIKEIADEKKCNENLDHSVHRYSYAWMYAHSAIFKNFSAEKVSESRR